MSKRKSKPKDRAVGVYLGADGERAGRNATGRTGYGAENRPSARRAKPAGGSDAVTVCETASAIRPTA